LGRDVAVQVFEDGLFAQAHGTCSSGTLGGSVGQLESLFDLQVGQARGFQDLGVLIHQTIQKRSI